MSVWSIYFDGLCEPRNPGGVMAWGFAIDREGDGDLVTKSGAVAAHPQNTNNIAEYYALGHALKWVVDSLIAERPERFSGLKIYGDSKLVVSQINGQWAVKAEHLRGLHGRCLELLEKTGQPWAIEWVPRERNELADSLSRKGYKELTGRDAPERARVA